MRGLRELACCATVAAVAAAGCGGSSGRDESVARVTIPAYGVTPETTMSGRAGARADGPACRADASRFADDARDFLVHFGAGAAYPADLNYVIIRGDLARLQAGRCDPGLLGEALRRRRTAKERADLVADLPVTMARAVRAGLALSESRR